MMLLPIIKSAVSHKRFNLILTQHQFPKIDDWSQDNGLGDRLRAIIASVGSKRNSLWSRNRLLLNCKWAHLNDGD